MSIQFLRNSANKSPWSGQLKVVFRAFGDTEHCCIVLFYNLKPQSIAFKDMQQHSQRQPQHGNGASFSEAEQQEVLQIKLALAEHEVRLHLDLCC